MTPKQTALVEVTKMVLVGLVVGALANAAFTYFTVTQIGIGFCVGMLGFLCKMVYDMEVAKAEHRASLDQLK